MQFAEERARQAYQAAKEGMTIEKYAAYVKKFPAYVMTNGLAATIAFAQSKKKEKNPDPAYKKICEQLHARLRVYGICEEENYNDFMDWLLKQDSGVYRRATAEVIAYLEWLRRFAGEE